MNLLSPHRPFPRLLLILSLFSAGALIPFIGLFPLMTLPTVLFVLCMMDDQRKTLFAFFIVISAILIPLSFMQTVLPVFALAVMGLAGILMTQTTRKNSSIEIVILVPSLFLLVAVTFYFIYGGMQLSMSPWQLIVKHVTEAIDINIQLYSRLPLNSEEINAIKNSRDSIIQLFTGIFPALCGIAVLFTIWINVLISNIILRKQNILVPNFSTLAEWKAPAWLVWFFIAGGGLSFLPQTQIHFAGINMFLMTSFVYLLQGLAIVSFFFKSKNISFFFRWLFYFLIAVQQIVMIAITLVGFLDLWIDFRKYFRKDMATD